MGSEGQASGRLLVQAREAREKRTHSGNRRLTRPRLGREYGQV